MFESNMTCVSSLKNSEKSIQVYIKIICQKKKIKKTFFQCVVLWSKILCRSLYHIITDEHNT